MYVLIDQWGDLVIVTQKLVQEIQNQGKNKGLYTSIPRYLL
ncbi:putative minor capsid protein 2 [Streptococcus pneumoniae GA41538]|nr:putative minor capsid protein 2 [Streptococcus pneumoniae GA41538]